MSRALLAATGGGTSPSPVEPDPLVLSSNVHIHLDGNSITAAFLVEGLHTSLTAALGAARNDATVTINATVGQGWTQMRDDSADVHAAWDPTKTNVLVVGEDTNSVFGQNMTLAQLLAARQSYFDTIRSVHPWVILLWGSIPRGRGNEATHPGEAEKNATLIAADEHAVDNYLDYGIHGFVSVRDIPQYAHDGTSPAPFVAYQNPSPTDAISGVTGWCETNIYHDPAVNTMYSNWLALGWTHPAAGVLPGVDAGHPMGTGKRAIAAKIATALTNGSLPATP